MKKAAWEKRIKENCEAAGTYQHFFDDIIDTLAGIMEARDDAEEKFQKDGAKAVVEHVNTRGGGRNIVKNPALVAVMELNAQALSYWRDLGLTPAGLKKINEAAIKGKKKSPLAEALKELGG